jgi:hypothetical protein
MRIVQHLTVHHDEHHYCTFPCLARAAGGDLLCGFRQAPLEPQGHSHLHSMSRAVLVRSSDDGLTWSAPLVVAPDDELGQQDPQVAVLPSGRVLASFFRWQAHANSELPELEQFRLHVNAKGCTWSNCGVAVCHSDDDGRTFSPIRRVPFPFGPRGGASRSPIVRLTSGRLLLACYDRPGKGKKDVSYLMRSDDQGLSWQFHAIMADGNADPAPYDVHEPHLHLRPDGTLYCFLRAYGEGGLMRQCTSTDGGLTWTAPRETRVWGFPQAALTLPDGRLLLACGHRREPLGLRVRLCRGDLADLDTTSDLGVREDGVTKDLGYPTLALRRDGTVLLAYYLNRPGVPATDHHRHVAATILAVD